MFPVTQEAIDLLNSDYRQTIEIIWYGTDRTEMITEKDISMGGLSFDRSCVTGNQIELGAACCSELSLTLDNEHGRFNDFVFEGAELFVRIGVKKYDARQWEHATTQYIDVGYFIIDEPSRKLASISISALDRMVLFDKTVDWSLITFPITLNDLLQQVCKICNVPVLIDVLKNRPNAQYQVLTAPTTDTTYRQIIQWIGELTASCSFIDSEGRLVMKWYEPTKNKVEITPSVRYSSDMLENDITISGVQMNLSDEENFLIGDDSYAFVIEGNDLLQDKHREVGENIYKEVKGFKYRPYECTTKAMPYLYPTDIIDYVDNAHVLHKTIVTNMSFTLNGETSVMGQGVTETNRNYASANPLTKRESILIHKIEESFNQSLNESTQSSLAFNELITNALGVYSTVKTLPDGSKQYYMHDAPTLETSTTIYTRNAGGFAFTNSGWNDGNPVWENGFSKDGNLVAKKVNAYGIEVSDPKSNYSSKITPGVFAVWYGDMQILTINGDTSVLTKVKVKDFIEIGKIRIVPVRNKIKTLIGTNIVYLDD